MTSRVPGLAASLLLLGLLASGCLTAPAGTTDAPAAPTGDAYLDGPSALLRVTNGSVSTRETVFEFLAPGSAGVTSGACASDGDASFTLSSASAPEMRFEDGRSERLFGPFHVEATRVLQLHAGVEHAPAAVLTQDEIMMSVPPSAEGSEVELFTTTEYAWVDVHVRQLGEFGLTGRGTLQWAPGSITLHCGALRADSQDAWLEGNGTMEVEAGTETTLVVGDAAFVADGAKARVDGLFRPPLLGPDDPDVLYAFRVLEWLTPAVEAPARGDAEA